MIHNGTLEWIKDGRHSGLDFWERYRNFSSFFLSPFYISVFRTNSLFLAHNLEVDGNNHEVECVPRIFKEVFFQINVSTKQIQLEWKRGRTSLRSSRRIALSWQQSIDNISWRGLHISTVHIGIYYFGGKRIITRHNKIRFNRFIKIYGKVYHAQPLH